MSVPENKGNNLLAQNINRTDNGLPLFYDNSAFFPIRKTIEKIEGTEGLPSHIKIERKSFTYKNSPELAMLRNEKQGVGSLLIVTPDLPGLDPNFSSKIYVFGTPENNAMTIGLVDYDKGGLPHFILPRFHLGTAVEYDMGQAMRQAFQAPEIVNLIDHKKNPEKKSFIVYFSREGHIVQAHEAIYDSLGVNIPWTVIHAEHYKDKSGVSGSCKRIAKICPMNLEGMDSIQNETLILCDNTASGMQLVAVAEDIVQRVSNESQGKNKPKNILVISPILTLYGASVMTYWANSNGINASFVCSGALLGCNPPDRYFSPLTANPDLCSDPDLIRLNHAAYGKAAGKACVWCNWTAHVASIHFALKRSEAELAQYGLTNQMVIEQSYNLKIGDFIKVNQIKNLVPYSVYRKRVMSTPKHE